MKRHSFSSISTRVCAAAFVVSTLAVLALSLSPSVYAQNADDTVALERALPAFEENSPTDETLPQSDTTPDSWSEERVLPAALDTETDDAPLMLAQFDPLETP